MQCNSDRSGLSLGTSCLADLAAPSLYLVSCHCTLKHMLTAMHHIQTSNLLPGSSAACRCMRRQQAAVLAARALHGLCWRTVNISGPSVAQHNQHGPAELSRAVCQTAEGVNLHPLGMLHAVHTLLAIACMQLHLWPGGRSDSRQTSATPCMHKLLVGMPASLSQLGTPPWP